MDSLISRFDPRFIVPYICKDDVGSVDQTVFLLKPLNVFEHRFCEEASTDDGFNIGNFGLRVLEFGLKDWKNFTYDNDEKIEFSIDNISAIPSRYHGELSSKILEMSEPNEKLVNELKFLAKWSGFISKHKDPDQWTCEYCAEKKFQKTRNCEYDIPNKCPQCGDEHFREFCDKCKRKMKPHFMFRFSTERDDYITRCPVSLITQRAVRLTNMVLYMKDSNSLPFEGGALEQTNFFYVVRSIVLSEQNQLIKKEMQEREEGAKGGN